MRVALESCAVDAMDPRRRTSLVIGPKVRQVGFVTPNTDVVVLGEGAVGMGAEKEAATLGVTTNSPSPVIIPPTRPVVEIPQKTEPVAVPSPSHYRRPNDVEVPSAPIGSYNSADPVLEGSSLPSSKAGLLLPPFLKSIMFIVFADSNHFQFTEFLTDSVLKFSIILFQHETSFGRSVVVDFVE